MHWAAAAMDHPSIVSFVATCINTPLAGFSRDINTQYILPLRPTQPRIHCARRRNGNKSTGIKVYEHNGKVCSQVPSSIPRQGTRTFCRQGVSVYPQLTQARVNRATDLYFTRCRRTRTSYWSFAISDVNDEMVFIGAWRYAAGSDAEPVEIEPVEFLAQSFFHSGVSDAVMAML
ncbi:hypothetical protein BDW22DRAFT_1359174 [Trametopsis cervina]|nr:hypothetical protein BDW22DRAFT_1359174 [Trametopsis cervina]